MIANHGSFLLLFNGAALLVCAVFDFAQRDTLLIAMMLLLPFIDRQWALPGFCTYRYRPAIWGALTAAIVLIAVFNSDSVYFILYTLLLVALPEEWFFRAYFLQRLERLWTNRWAANIATSALFAVLHVPTQGMFGMSVFVPSLILGWLYQQRRDIVLVILLHALANLVYLTYLQELFAVGSSGF